MGSRRRTAICVAVLCAGAAAGLLWWRNHPAPPAAAGPAGTVPAVATVEKGDLTDSVLLTGDVGFGPSWQVSGPAEGTVTWLPAVGTTVRRGRPILRVDDRPVLLFYGGTPMFRQLDRLGLVGRDVRVVADNLAALGFGTGRQPRPGTVVRQPPPAAPAIRPAANAESNVPTITVKAGEGVVTVQLQTAIRRWQASVGLPPTGTLGVGEVLVQSNAVRVTTRTAQLGAPAAGQLLGLTGIARVVTVQTSPVEAGDVEPGANVTVTLPDGKTAKGRVERVAQSTDQSGEAQETITVTPLQPLAQEAGNVQVEVAGEVRHGVLTVPVGALLALSEGGYAVQLAGGGLVAVKTGLITNGLAEISGPGIGAGTAVVTAS